MLRFLEFLSSFVMTRRHYMMRIRLYINLLGEFGVRIKSITGVQ
jgi:hypothetical protein